MGALHLSKSGAVSFDVHDVEVAHAALSRDHRHDRAARKARGCRASFAFERVRRGDIAQG